MKKLLTIIFDSSIDDSMKDLLSALDLPGITWIHEVWGHGGRGHKMGTAVFPGSNNIALVVLPAEDVARVHRAVRRLQGGYRLKPGITMLLEDVEELD